MSIPILEACKKRKRRPQLHGFHTFGDPGCPIDPKGAFRDNIRLFLQQCAELDDNNVQGMPAWCTLLVHETKSFIVPLYTIEEDVKYSPRPYCDHCRCAGLALDFFFFFWSEFDCFLHFLKWVCCNFSFGGFDFWELGLDIC